MLNVKKVLTKIINAHIEKVTASSATSVLANGGTAWIRVDIPSNINPICIVGYYLENGSGCSVYNISLGSDANGKYASFAVRNAQSTINNVTITVHILAWGG